MGIDAFERYVALAVLSRNHKTSSPSVVFPCYLFFILPVPR
jgi:hypothetical protein